VVEAREAVGDIEASLIENIKAADIPAILVVNKIDAVRPANIAKTIEAYAAAHDFAAVIPISAKHDKGVDTVVEECGKFLYESEWFFPDDILTDQPERQLAAEVIREKLLRLLEEEIPHGTAVSIEEWKEKKDVISIRAEIYCEKASHKGMIIGKNGQTIKTVGTYAREDLEKMLGTRIFLDLYVRVKENWRDSDFTLRNFGYNEEN
jgi:GTP-binding protein Era